LAALVLPGTLGCFSVGGADRYLVFATGTKFGLDFTQRADQTVDITMGYDRVEIASIPTSFEGQATPEEDVYSVLGSFCVRYSTPWTDARACRLRQVFATGEAAYKAASDEDMRKYFEEIASGDTKRCMPRGAGGDQ